MYSVLLSKKGTTTLLTAPFQPARTPVANKTYWRRLIKKGVKSSPRWIDPTLWPKTFNTFVEKGVFWTYAVKKWENSEKNMDALLGPRDPDTYAAALTIQKFKEDDAPIQEWEEDIKSSDPIAEKPFGRPISETRKKVRRRRYRTIYARLNGKYSLASIYNDAKDKFAEEFHKRSPTKQIKEEDVEKRENLFFKLLDPLSDIRHRLWKTQYEFIRKREILIQDVFAMKQIGKLIRVALPSFTERMRVQQLREEYFNYSGKLEEAIKKPPPGETQVYPYSFYPPGYQEPKVKEINPYNKLPYTDPNDTSPINPNNSFQIKNDLTGSIWSRFKDSISYFLFNTSSSSTPKSYSQKLEETVLNSTIPNPNIQSSKETALVPVQQKPDAPYYFQMNNAKYSTWNIQDFNARLRDIKLTTMKGINPELSKHNLRLELVYGIFPKLLKLLYGPWNPIDLVKYCDLHLARKLTRRHRMELVRSKITFHKIVRIFKSRFFITARNAKKLRLRVNIRSLETLTRRKLNRPLFGGWDKLYTYYTTIIFVPNTMEPFKWKILRFRRRRRKALMRPNSDPGLRRVIFGGTRTKKKRTNKRKKKRRMRLRKRSKKYFRRFPGRRKPVVPMTTEQRQMVKNHMRWPGRFAYPDRLAPKEKAEFLKKKYGIISTPTYPEEEEQVQEEAENTQYNEEEEHNKRE